MKLNLKNLLGQFGSVDLLNQNFNNIESELQNKVLYRDNPDGEPNAMQNDLDMNSFSILNAGEISSTGGTNNNSSNIINADTISDLQNIDITNFSTGKPVIMIERISDSQSGGGFFYLIKNDLSTEVSFDEITTGEGDGGIYIAPASDKTGSSGAWVRFFENEIHTSWYGLGDGTDQVSLFQEIVSKTKPNETWVFDKDFTTSGKAIISNKSGVNIKSLDCVISEIGEIDSTFEFSNCNRCIIEGFRVIGDEDEDTFVADNIGPSFYFVRFVDSNDCHAQFNIISEKSAGFHIQRCTNCVAKENKHVGIFQTPVNAPDQVNGVNSFFVESGSHNYAIGNKSINAGTGIITGLDSDYAFITNNYVLADRDNSIYISSGTNCLVEGNTCVNSHRGSGCKARGDRTRVVNNCFDQCLLGVTISGEPGINVDVYNTNGNYSIVSNNIFTACSLGVNIDLVMDSDNDGVDDEFCRDAIVNSNKFVSCGGNDPTGNVTISLPSAIRIRGGNGHSIDNNWIDSRLDINSSNAIAFFTNNSPIKHGYSVSHNTFRGADWNRVISVDTVVRSNFIGNQVISDNPNTMLWLENVTDSDISHNSSVGSGSGVEIRNGSKNNILAYNRASFHLAFDTNNAFYGNIPVEQDNKNFALTLDTWELSIAQHQSLMVIASVEVVATDSSNAEIIFDLDENGGTTATNSFRFASVDRNSVEAGTSSEFMTGTFYVPRGASFQLRNSVDPNGTNNIQTIYAIGV